MWWWRQQEDAPHSVHGRFLEPLQCSSTMQSAGPPAMDGKAPRIDDLFAVVSDAKLLEWRESLITLERTDNPAERADAARKLKICVGRLARELSTETFNEFERRLQSRVVEILNQPVSVARGKRFNQKNSSEKFLPRVHGGIPRRSSLPVAEHLRDLSSAYMRVRQALLWMRCTQGISPVDTLGDVSIQACRTFRSFVCGEIKKRPATSKQRTAARDQSWWFAMGSKPRLRVYMAADFAHHTKHSFLALRTLSRRDFLVLSWVSVRAFSFHCC